MSYVGNKPAQTTIPADDAVTTAMLQDDAVTSAKIDDGTIATADIADDAVTADKVANAINTSIAANTSKVTNATHTGDVTGATALTIAANAVNLAKLEDGTQGDILYYGASGAPTRLGFGTTGDFLKTQGTGANPVWATATGGDNTPAFQAYRSSNQTISHDIYTKIECQAEDFDTDTGYDNSSTYLYTVPSGEGGVYWLYARVDYAAASDGKAEYGNIQIRVNAETNSTASFSTWWNWRDNPGRQPTVSCGGMRTLAAADTVGFYAYGADWISTSSWVIQGSDRRDTVVGAYKMIGIT